MELKDILEKRRSYRSLEKADIGETDILELVHAASLSPSCFNNQPWRFVFVKSPDVLGKVYAGLSRGNEWVTGAGAILAVFARKSDDCVIKEREYFLFDTGMASGFLILRAWDMGLVAHPIAGYDESVVRQALNIPADSVLIALVAVGKKAASMSPLLSEKQASGEKDRPPRKALHQLVWIDRYKG